MMIVSSNIVRLIFGQFTKTNDFFKIHEFIRITNIPICFRVVIPRHYCHKLLSAESQHQPLQPILKRPPVIKWTHYITCAQYH